MTRWRRLRDWTLAGVWDKAPSGAPGAASTGRAKIDWSRAVIDSSSVRAVFGGRRPAQIPRIAAKRGSKRPRPDRRRRYPARRPGPRGDNRHDVTQLDGLGRGRVPPVRKAGGGPADGPTRCGRGPGLRLAAASRLAEGRRASSPRPSASGGRQRQRPGQGPLGRGADPGLAAPEPEASGPSDEKRADIHDGFLKLGGQRIICFKRLQPSFC